MPFAHRKNYRYDIETQKSVYIANICQLVNFFCVIDNVGVLNGGGKLERLHMKYIPQTLKKKSPLKASCFDLGIKI